MFKKDKIQIDEDKPVLEHLDELRKRLLVIAISIIAVTIFLYTQAETLFKFLKRPVEGLGQEFAFFSMTDAFVTRFKVALVVAVVFLSPLVFYQLMAFISPGLREIEKRLIYRALFFIIPAFVGGTAFGYIYILPRALRFMISFGSSYMTPVLSGEKYLSFIALFCVAVGVVFTIPVIMVFLGKMGVLSSSLLKKARKFIIFGILVGEGIIVSDFMSFALIAVPFILIYEISLWTVIIMEKRRSRVPGEGGKRLKEKKKMDAA